MLHLGERERAVQLADTAALECAIRARDARLVIIDPIAAYLGSTDSHRDADVRGLLVPLAAIAERTQTALLGVMHLAKSSQRPAIYHAAGSIAFAAAARIVLAGGVVDRREPDRHPPMAPAPESHRQLPRARGGRMNPPLGGEVRQ